MTKNKSVITSGQLFGMLFITRMIVNMTYTPLLAGGDVMWDHILSAAISFVLVFVMVISVYKMCNIRGGIDVANASYVLLGKAGAVVCVIYALYYAFVSIYTLSLFNSFVSNDMSPKIPILALSFAVIVVSCYAAYKGIEGIARASFLILLLVIIALIFIIIALLPQVDSKNFIPFMYNGNKQMVNGVILMLSRTSCIPAMAMLFPAVKGNKKKGLIIWNIAVYATVSILIAVIVGSLGDYLKTQSFPVYTATCIAEMGILKKLDALYLGIWITGLFIKVSLFIYLLAACIQRIFGEKASKISIFISGIIIASLSYFISKYKEIIGIVYNLKVIMIFTLITAVVIPLILLVINSIKCRRVCK